MQINLPPPGEVSAILNDPDRGDRGHKHAMRRVKELLKQDDPDPSGLWDLLREGLYAEALSFACKGFEMPYPVEPLLEQIAAQGGNWENFLQYSFKLGVVPPQEDQQAAYAHIRNRRSKKTGRPIPDSESKVQVWQTKFRLLELRLQGNWDEYLQVALDNEYLPPKSEWDAAMAALPETVGESWTRLFRQKAQAINLKKWRDRFLIG